MHGYYFLYKRHLKTGIVYYYKAYRPDGSLSSGKTTGCRNKRLTKIFCDTLLKDRSPVFFSKNLPKFLCRKSDITQRAGDVTFKSPKLLVKSRLSDVLKFGLRVSIFILHLIYPEVRITIFSG